MQKIKANKVASKGKKSVAAKKPTQAKKAVKPAKSTKLAKASKPAKQAKKAKSGKTGSTKKAKTGKSSKASKPVPAAKRVRKPLTDEQRARKNAKDRERRARIKAAKLAAAQDKRVHAKAVASKKSAKKPVKKVAAKPSKKACRATACRSVVPAKAGCGGCQQHAEDGACRRYAPVSPVAVFDKLAELVAGQLVRSNGPTSTTVAERSFPIPGGELHITVAKTVRTSNEGNKPASFVLSQLSKDICRIVDARRGR